MGLIEEFVERKTRSYDSRNSYKYFLNKYFSVLNIDDIDSYFKQNRDYADDLFKFAAAISEMSPKSQVVFLSVIKNLFERNDVEIKKRVWDDIKVKNKIRRARPITQKRTPTNSDLRKILNYGDVKSRALFVMASTTGMRINELLNITFKDIDFENRHIRIRREIAKGAVPRDTFFTVEANEILSNWLSVRDKFLISKIKKSLYFRVKLKKEGYQVTKSEDDEWNIYKNGKQISDEEILERDDRIFPFEYSPVSIMWHNLLEKAGSPYDVKDGKYYLYNIHSLRRFWFSQLESSGANMAHINFMGGHESELNATYTHFELRDLRETYDSKMNALAIFSDMHMVEKVITPKLKEQETQLSALTREYQRVVNDFEQFKKIVYYSIGVPPISDKEIQMRENLKDVLPPLDDNEMKVIEAYRKLGDKMKRKKV